MKSDLNIGLIGIGLSTYWDQFEGLLDRLNGYRQRVKEMIERDSVSVLDAGMIDDPVKARLAANKLRAGNVDMLFIYVSTYALSSTVLPVVQKLNIPVIILNLQSTSAMDYQMINSLGDRGAMTGEWLAYCQACPVPEIASVFNRSNVKYDIITGYLDDPKSRKQIDQWILAMKVYVGMSQNRLGVLGNYYGGMVDVYSDLTLQSVVFGTHIEIVEMCELISKRNEVTPEQEQLKIDEFGEVFDVDTSCTIEELRRAARTSVALDRLVEEHQLGSLAYFYEGTNGNEYENTVTSIIAGNTILTGKGIPVAGEYEIKNVQAMKILSLMGAGGSFSEFYSMDFDDDVILLGHDGPANYLLAEGKVSLVPLPVYHGKPGKGLSIQMSVKQGPVTLLSVVEGNDGISLLVAEGESVAGPILNFGNVNSRYKFPISSRDFINRWSKAGPSHHCAIGIGHVADILKKLAMIIGIRIEIIA